LKKEIIKKSPEGRFNEAESSCISANEFVEFGIGRTAKQYVTHGKEHLFVVSCNDLKFYLV